MREHIAEKTSDELTFSTLCLQAQGVVSALRQQHKYLVTLESCTGGLVAAALTSVSGSSEVFYGGLIPYANDAKSVWAHVPSEILSLFGAVSAETALAMANGGLIETQADLALSITGIAGPLGGSPDKPVGLVHCAAKDRSGAVRHEKHLFSSAFKRQTLQLLSAQAAFTLLGKMLSP